MCSPSVLPFNISSCWTDEEIITSLDKFTCESSPLLPCNVIEDINPYQYMPANLPDGVWYLVRSDEKGDTELGFWKAKGDQIGIYKNSVITGWKTTLEFYEGQALNGKRTDWVMQEYKLAHKDANNRKKDLLCRVFLNDGQRHSISSIIDITSQNCFHTVPLIVPKSHWTSEQGSTNAFQVKDREDLTELDCISRGDYLELNDLVDLESSFSSDNFSWLSLTSDECFDSMALLEDLEHECNNNLQMMDPGSKFSVSEAAKPNEVVMLPARLGHLISRNGSKSPTKGIESGSAIEEKSLERPAVKRQRAGDGIEGTSHSGNKTSSGNENPDSEGERKVVGRMKKIMRYLCLVEF